MRRKAEYVPTEPRRPGYSALLINPFIDLPLPIIRKCPRLHAQHFFFFYSNYLSKMNLCFSAPLNSDNSKILSVWHPIGPKSVFPNAFTRLSFTLLEPIIPQNTTALESLLSTCPPFPTLIAASQWVFLLAHRSPIFQSYLASPNIMDSPSCLWPTFILSLIFFYQPLKSLLHIAMLFFSLYCVALLN